MDLSMDHLSSFPVPPGQAVVDGYAVVEVADPDPAQGVAGDGVVTENSRGLLNM
jgi:hypothetical protein